MTQVEAQDMLWLLVRIKRHQAGGIKTTTVGGEFEAYRDRAGRVRKRRVSGTGSKAFVSELILRRSGFEVFLPVKKVERRKNRFGPDTHLVAQPLLLDWMFVGWPSGEERWQDLMDLDVVMGIMGTGGRPIYFPPRRVARLMRQWGGGHLSSACHQMAKQKFSYVSGDVIKVPDGPFAGFDFTVVDVTTKSARGVIDIFGRETPLEIALSEFSDRDRVMNEILPLDPDAEILFDPTLSACRCGHRMAEITPESDGYCVICGHCGGRGAVGSKTKVEASGRWNEWLSSRA